MKIENKYIERYLSNQKMPYKGTIANWSFDIINSNKAIIGDIYQCFGYTDGRTISTSPIISVSIESVRAKEDKFVVVTTTNSSKYILLRPDSIFTSFINNCFEDNEDKSKGNQFTFETLEGTKNIIEWYLTK